MFSNIAQYMLLFLVFCGKFHPVLNFYVVKCSYSSRPFLCALGRLKVVGTNRTTLPIRSVNS